MLLRRPTSISTIKTPFAYLKLDVRPLVGSNRDRCSPHGRTSLVVRIDRHLNFLWALLSQKRLRNLLCRQQKWDSRRIKHMIMMLGREIRSKFPASLGDRATVNSSYDSLQGGLFGCYRYLYRDAGSLKCIVAAFRAERFTSYSAAHSAAKHCAAEIWIHIPHPCGFRLV